jgi:(1->4)-alpha-D-glucan 1-alpha-D-glucosylmutase
LLKITTPGIPDFYQGSELWDFRLVDPDNRGPVDFEKRVRLLAELQQQEEQRDRLHLIQDLLNRWQDGRIKLFLTSRALNFRRAHPQLFLEGAYRLLQATGAKKMNVFAFMKHTRDAWAITAVPRLVTKLAPPGRPPTGDSVWAVNALLLPRKAPTDWVNVLTGERLQACALKQRLSLPLAKVFGKFPVALLAA